MNTEGHMGGVLDRLPSALITLGPDMKVTWRNRFAAEATPTLEPGVDVWRALEPLASVEKIDRLILRGERVNFRPRPDRPTFDWMVAGDRLEDGGLILMAWDPDLTDDMAQRRSTFVMGASHELRSPLTALVGFAEILALDEENLSPRQAESVSMILQNAQYLSSLVDDVIDLSRNSFGELRLALEPVDVSGVAQSVAESVRPQIEAKNQTLETGFATDLPLVEADVQRLRQVLVNLVQNANIHSGEGCRIDVWTGLAGDGVVIGVADTGPGLPFDDPEDAYTSFQRGAFTGADKGSGVGLTITKRLIELHRGRIEIETARGEGTLFRVWLPLDRSSSLEFSEPGPA